MKAKNQNGFAHIIILTILLGVTTLSLLGYVFYQNYSKNESQSKVVEAPKKDDTEDKTPVAKNGFIEGSLSYPSSFIPEMGVYAVNVDTGAIYSTTDNIKSSDYVYGTGYKLEVPAGSYNVYGSILKTQGAIKDTDKAYYNESIGCSIASKFSDSSCDSKAKGMSVVVVKSAETVKNINVGDWYNL